MKKVLSILALVIISTVPALATKTTTTTTTVILGKNLGTTVAGPTVTVNCDNFYTQECYTVTTTTTTESNVQINHGENIIVTAYDIDGLNPQVVLQGDFDWADIENNGSQLTSTFAIIEL